MMLKKLKCLFTVVMVLILSSQSMNVALANNQINNDISEAVSQNDDYVAENFEALLSEADSSTIVETATIESNEGDIYNVPIYNIDSTELSDEEGNSLNIVAQTYAYDLSNAVLIQSSLGSGNSTRDQFDSTFGVEGYITIYYTYDSYLNGLAYILTRVSGGYTKYDSTESVVSQQLVYGEGGVSGNNIAVNIYSYQYPTTSSWNYYTGFTTSCVLVGNYTFGATYTISIARGLSTWTLMISNLL